MKTHFVRPYLAAAVVAVFAAPASAATCTPTGFFRDGINMTAALVNPPYVTHEVDATGCNVGVFFADGISARVDDANIHGANYFGVLVLGNNGNTHVDIENSRIHDIGESPLNGSQHGIAIYYRAEAGTTSGRISDNRLSNYQKGGIVANFTGTKVVIDRNTVTGQGPVAYIAQNGIQVGYGAEAAVLGNTVTGHSYTGSSTVSGGIIVVGGPGYGEAYTVNTIVAGNTVVNNDIGVFLTNLAADGGAPDVATNVTVASNTISSNAVTNGLVYQAGISVVGNGDRILLNTISGVGYNPATIPQHTYAIDADPLYAPNARIYGNRIRQ
jgi:hypothetical protein